MDTMIEYQQAQEHLRELKREAARLPETLRRAAESFDAAELVRLKRRKEEITAEIFSAQVMVYKTNLACLRAEQSEAETRLAKARADSKKMDAECVASLRVLDEERKRINESGLRALSLVYELQNEMQRRGNEITAVEQVLTELLEEAA